MYTHRPNLLLAFHGCDRNVCEALVLGTKQPEPSENSFDWLGSGIYFWENDPERALDWAIQYKKNPINPKQIIEEPAVLGAVIALNNCLDLLDTGSIQLVAKAHDSFLEYAHAIGSKIPANKGDRDRSGRYLDCAVINFLHQMIKDGSLGNVPPFDSVRAMFPEGESLYEGAGFRKQNHIQICIRNADCIKGFFIPRSSHGMIVE
jgi:hypothetical protein